MGNLTPRGVVVTMLLFSLIITGGFWLYGIMAVENGVAVDEDTSAYLDEFVQFNSSAYQLQEDVQAVTNSSNPGFLGQAADYFSWGITFISTLMSAPGVFIKSIGFLSTVPIFNAIPLFVWNALGAIGVITIIFVLVSAWMRYKT